MSKASKFFRSDGGQILTSALLAYAKKQSADVRRVASVVEPVVTIYETAKATGSSDPLRDTIYATAADKLLEKPVVTGDNVNPIDFAMDLIRAPFLQKLKDRTYQVLITTAITATTGAYAAWNTAGLPASDKVNLTFAALGAWAIVGAAFTASEKKKDAEIATAAIHATSFQQSQAQQVEVEMHPTEPLSNDVAARFNEAAVIGQEAANGDR